MAGQQRQTSVWGVLFALGLGAVGASGAGADPLGRIPEPLPEHSARRVLAAAEQAQFLAIGQVSNISGGRHCTGTLIAPDLVLTAAHCVTSRTDTWTAPAYRILFQPGIRHKVAETKRIGAALSVPDAYLINRAIKDDLALLRLKDPISPEVMVPLSVADDPMLRGRVLSIYSYGYDAPYALAEEAECRALAPMDKAMVTTCEAVGGVSGAPVVTRDDDGVLRVTAVVSSRLARTGGAPGYGRAVVVPVDAARLADLMAGLSEQPGG